MERLEDWQLNRDEDATLAKLKTYKEASTPDQRLIEYERANLKAIRDEKRRRAPTAPAIESRTDQPARKASEIIGSLSDTFTPAAKEAAAELSKLKESL